MRTEQEMFSMILDAAKADGRIRAVYMNGSRVNPEAKHDIFQDYDIAYVVTETESFREDRTWIDRFGERLYMQYPEENREYPSDVANCYGWLIQFADGNRLDLHVQTLSWSLRAMEEDRMFRILYDKDGCLAKAPEPAAEFYRVKRPEESRFLSVCNEFWWCLNNVAKGIARDELPYAMEMFQKYVRDMLNEMVRWAIGVRTGFTVSAGKCGKYFKRYLPESQYRLYAQTYASGDYTSLWAAVFTACELFRLTAGEVGAYFAFAYDEREDQNMTAYLLAVKTQWEQAGTP